MRIIADHLRAANAMAENGVVPGNKLQGYVMRRLIRRAVLKMKNLKGEIITSDFEGLTKSKAILQEIDKFQKTLDKGLREAEKIDKIDGQKAFDLYQTYGFPLELTIEIFEEKGQKIDKEEFQNAFEQHKEKSRTASAGKFKGGLADHSEETTGLHTATHLLHASLHKVLGDKVSQKGSNITAERLRFDFTYPQALTEKQIKQVEDLINQQIDKDLVVNMQTMTLEEAKKSAALAFFGDKYGEKVNVYTIGNPQGEWFSKEVCGGPHVKKLSELGGHVRITKEQGSSAGVRRIYAVIE
jgi:alanyl-tRNA synthetase